MNEKFFPNKVGSYFNFQLGIAIFLGFLIFLVYRDVSSFDFITLDDYTYIVNNPEVQKGVSIEGIKWAFSGSISMYIPLTFISYMLDWQIYAGYPGGFHCTNLILHMLNSILLLMVLTKYTKSIVPSLFVTFLFAFHPIHVESIAWVSERKDVLSTFFFLMSISIYHRQVESSNILNSTMLIVSYFLGLLSKPMLVTFPFVLLLMDYWPLNRFKLNNATIKQSSRLKNNIFRILELIREKTSLFLLSISFSAFTFMAQRAHGGLVSFKVFPFNVRFENALLSYAVYIKKLFWPMDLAVFYPHPMDTISVTALGMAILLLLGISVCVIATKNSHPYLLMGWLWYLGTMIPVIGISQSGMQAMADRFAYIPFIGLYIMLSWSTYFLINKAKIKYNYFVYISVLLIVMPMMLLITRNQINLWRDSETLYEHTIKVTQNNFIIHHAIGDILVRKGRFQEAKGHFDRALKIEPRFTNPLFYLGKIHQIQGQTKEAITTYYQIIEEKPDFYPAQKQLGYLWLQLGNLGRAIFHLQNAVSINPNDSQLYNDLGTALLHEQEVKNAIFYFRKAIELDANNIDYQKNYQRAVKMASHVN